MGQEQNVLSRNTCDDYDDRLKIENRTDRVGNLQISAS